MKKIFFFNILLSAGISINILVLFFRFPLSKILHEIILERDERSIFFITGVDKLLSELAPEGNIFLRFDGFKTEGGQGWGTPEDAASIIYFRATYFLHPRRVYVGPENLKIVRGTEFLQLKFEPDDEWLRARDVRGILTLRRLPEGQVSWDYQCL